MISRIVSFAPVARQDASVLILGSMPGEASLKASQYYAHARNAFWPIMGELTGLDPGASYQVRLEALQASGIALWDVMRSCRRAGSLDSAIEPESIEANDFAAFFKKHSRIVTVCFNGATAERCYRQNVLPKVGHLSFTYVRLPSTSPAHAALSLASKITVWRSAIQDLPAAPASLRKSATS